MLGLTLWPEWAWCICYLGKRVENRTWLPRPTQLKPGDRFAIHAGAAPGRAAATPRLGLACETAARALRWREDLVSRVRLGRGQMCLELNGARLPSPWESAGGAYNHEDRVWHGTGVDSGGRLEATVDPRVDPQWTHTVTSPAPPAPTPTPPRG